ncbi:hypothetical protein A2Y83_02425 [Candidatus Falkowbacteria bacterium RBG_13_39_14]|uniref:Uncharacterized protein n=1 Tax=Candidatus Falkowbacteria bacterium RBG_13_39_14 TaxID=1797985 RepID=A0A1F5SAA1_9BACT|nr:MAG: hypothetical protein A2Y83_02425 [Candidatus Falkowbacteria bacterium RBG_13_39_14]
MKKYMPKIEKFPTEILENSRYDFEVEEDGLYLIEIIAGAKSWWQNLKKLRAFFDDDDLAVNPAPFRQNIGNIWNFCMKKFCCDRDMGFIDKKFINV